MEEWEPCFSYVALGQPVEAARLLARRPEQPALRAASEVCMAAGESGLALQYAQRYVMRCNVEWNWEGAKELTRQHQSFKVGRDGWRDSVCDMLSCSWKAVHVGNYLSFPLAVTCSDHMRP